MDGGEVVRRARARAGLSRAALAGRLPGRSEHDVDGWEDGAVEPTFADVDAAVRAVGCTLDGILGEPEVDPHDAALLDTTLALTVDERLERMLTHVRFVRAGQAAMRAAR
ncbi:MAG: helix-turn-helix domain-containing protein [Pseudonocardia sp.]|nr:helix-turn-helix domain-containing protein [Pseudonocardia sp.]